MPRDLALGVWDDIPPATIDQALATDHVARVTLAEGYELHRPPVAEVFDPSARGIFDYLRAPRRIRVDPVDLLVFRDATVIPQRFVVSNRDELFIDYPLDAETLALYVANRFDIKPAEHQLAPSPDAPDRWRTARLDAPPIDRSGTTFLATGSEPINYGAWLIRSLPKLELLRDLPRAAHDTTAAPQILCYADRPFIDDLIALAGHDPAQIARQSFDAAYRCETLLLPSWPNRHKYLHRHTVGMLARMRDGVLARATGSSPEAIFVSRLHWNQRQDEALRRAGRPRMRPFDQEEELIARFEALGIVPFFPEEHPVERTIETFARARLVIGAQGAGLFNAIFCRPGTTVIEIAHLPDFANGHTSMFMSAGLDYRVVVGRDDGSSTEPVHPTHRPLTIDLDEVVDFVARRLQSVQEPIPA